MDSISYYLSENPLTTSEENLFKIRVYLQREGSDERIPVEGRSRFRG